MTDHIVDANKMMNIPAADTLMGIFGMKRLPIHEREEMKTQLSPEAIEWLANGERGISSETMFWHLAGIRRRRAILVGHPHDPADFIRCEKMLAAVPEFRERMWEMITVSPVWAKLVDHWQEIITSIHEEAPRWDEGIGSANKAYALMGKLGCRG